MYTRGGTARISIYMSYMIYILSSRSAAHALIRGCNASSQSSNLYAIFSKFHVVKNRAHKLSQSSVEVTLEFRVCFPLIYLKTAITLSFRCGDHDLPQ